MYSAFDNIIHNPVELSTHLFWGDEDTQMLNKHYAFCVPVIESRSVRLLWFIKFSKSCTKTLEPH